MTPTPLEATLTHAARLELLLSLERERTTALEAALKKCAVQLEAVVRWNRDMDVRDCKVLAAGARATLAKGSAA